MVLIVPGGRQKHIMHSSFGMLQKRSNWKIRYVLSSARLHLAKNNNQCVPAHPGVEVDPLAARVHAAVRGSQVFLQGAGQVLLGEGHPAHGRHARRQLQERRGLEGHLAHEPGEVAERALIVVSRKLSIFLFYFKAWLGTSPSNFEGWGGLLHKVRTLPPPTKTGKK